MSVFNTFFVQVGPRFCLNPIKIFSGSFGGPTLYENPFYVSPNTVSSVVVYPLSSWFCLTISTFIFFSLFLCLLKVKVKLLLQMDVQFWIIINLSQIKPYSWSFPIPFSRFALWRKGRRLGNMQRRLKPRPERRCMSWKIPSKLMSLLICGRSKNLITFGMSFYLLSCSQNLVSSTQQEELCLVIQLPFVPNM